MIVTNKLKRPNSLAFRVTILVGITVFLCLTIISLIVQQSIATHFAEQDADELNEVFHAVKRKLSEAYTEKVAPSSILVEAVSGHHGVYYLVQNEDGESVFSSKDVDLHKYPGQLFDNDLITPDMLTLFFDGSHMLRATEALVTVSTGQNKSTYRVVVASNMEFHMNYMEDFEKTLWGIIFVSGLITIIVARFAVYRGHSPLRKLSRKIGSITADKLDIRLNPLEVPVELAGLVGSFNAMIERLEAGFEQLSYFSADIAHELRTPVTNLTTQTQVILNQPRTESEYVDILYSNLEEYERMTKMVSDMLLLAKTEHGLVKPQLERLNCRAELQELVEYFELLAEERQIQIRIRGADATIDCDRSMFRQAMSNLLSNAIRYSFENAIVKVAVSTNDEHTKITVSNPGPKISDDHLQRLFDRFFRADPSRKNHGQGVGLGLTIARSLLHMNGAKLTVSSDDNLTVFVVSFHK